MTQENVFLALASFAFVGALCLYIDCSRVLRKSRREFSAKIDAEYRALCSAYSDSGEDLL